jgi:hypothetical protein
MATQLQFFDICFKRSGKILCAVLESLKTDADVSVTDHASKVLATLQPLLCDNSSSCVELSTVLITLF